MNEDWKIAASRVEQYMGVPQGVIADNPAAFNQQLIRDVSDTLYNVALFRSKSFLPHKYFAALFAVSAGVVGNMNEGTVGVLSAWALTYCAYKAFKEGRDLSSAFNAMENNAQTVCYQLQETHPLLKHSDP